MTEKKDLIDGAELRRRAEEKLVKYSGTAAPPVTMEDQLRLLHELQVHQIELEIQNAELRQARDEAEAALEKYTDIYDFAPVGYFTLDRDGTIRAANLTGSSLLGVERSRLIGRRFGHFVADEARPAFAAFLEKAFTSATKEACEVALLNEEKSALFVQIEGVAAASGQECRIALIDVTERKRAAQLQYANIELEAFNYTIAHDLRKPLTVVNGYCQTIRELCGDKLDEQCKDYLRKAYDGTLRMNRLIDALLNFSRMASCEIKPETVDLSAMAREITAELRAAEKERRVTFAIAEGVTVDGDPSLLRVVLENLIGNAWKYTGMREEALIEFGVTDINGRPACFVRDNGPGFDMAYAGKLFLPFQRLPGAEEFRGFGIGLATVERIIRRHGGRIWAGSEPDKGATFWFTLPTNES
ncbi:MAG TPA: ATP-binding protein [Geobacteraceae bacterium]|nr:ATP-binding protein [Geobacteraceae bacterium]